MMNQYNGILTDQSIFRYFFREIGQFRSTWLRFGEDKTMRASSEHVDMSTLVRACDSNRSLRFLWASEFEINSN